MSEEVEIVEQELDQSEQILTKGGANEGDELFVPAKVPPRVEKGLAFWSDRWKDVVPTDGQWRPMAAFVHSEGGVQTHKTLQFGQSFGFRIDDAGAAPKRGGLLLDGAPVVTAKVAGVMRRVERIDHAEWRPLAAGEDFLEWQERRESEGGHSYRVRRWEREGLRVVTNQGKPLPRRGRPDVAWRAKGEVLWPRESDRPGRGLALVDIESEVEGRVDSHILKRDEEQRYTLGVVYYALRKDAHGDQMTPAELEKSAWGYTIKSRRVGMMHSDGTDGSGEVVESYIYRGPDWKVNDQTVKAGDWLMGVVWSKSTWRQIKAGKLTGYSLQGMASRVPD